MKSTYSTCRSKAQELPGGKDLSGKKAFIKAGPSEFMYNSDVGKPKAVENELSIINFTNPILSIIREVDDQLITVSDGDEDPDEDVTNLKLNIKCYRIFNKRYEDIIQRLFGMDYDFYKRMVHDQTFEKSIAGSHFQRSDIMRM